ncbi:MAG: hypothetical protein IKM97_06065 [Clostridia bacterium]|nr:hypothetical protein [Clostridia bacterium]
MAIVTSLRIKIRHWFRNNKKIFIIAIILVGIIFTINRFLLLSDDIKVPNTTYTPTVSVMDSTDSSPKVVQSFAEDMIEEYVKYCNEGNYQKAFNMLSDDCKKYGFNDDVSIFMEHVLSKMQTPKKYSIQNYSNYKGFYIYEVKYIDDILATGLTNQKYLYSTEKIVFTKDKDNKLNMSTGNFISYNKINNILENDYLKVDVIDKITKYSIETYNVKITNRTDSTIVIADNLVADEVKLVLPYEYRNMENSNTLIILEPEESRTFNLGFSKFFDDGDTSKAILFGAIRVIEDYKGAYGTEEEQKKEIENAIAKFSIEIPLK